MSFDDELQAQETVCTDEVIYVNETSNQNEESKSENNENKLVSEVNGSELEYKTTSSPEELGNNESNEINTLTQQLVYERNENERLQENINGLQESLIKCKHELLEYQKRAYDSEIVSTRHQHEYKVLEHEKTSLQESLKRQKEETSIVESKLKELHTLKNNNLLEYTKKVSNLEVSCRDLEHRISIIQKSRDELEIEHSKTCDELRRVKSELEFAKGHYEEKIKIKEESIKLKEEQINQIQGLLDMSISTAQNLENEIEQYKKNEEASLSDQSKHKIMGGSKPTGEATSRAECRQLTDTQAAELLIKIFGEKFLNNISSSDEEESCVNSSNVCSRRILIDLLTQIEDYQQNLEESRREIHTLKEELKECRFRLNSAVPDFEITRQQYETLQAENSFAIEQLQSLTQERRILTHQISEYKTLWKHETNKREIYEEQYRMITSKLSALASSIENREGSVDDTLEIEKTAVSYNSSSISAHSSTAEIYDIIEQNTQLKLQISRLIDGIEMESQIQVKKLNSEVASYREQLTKMKNERDDLISQYQEFIKKLEDENSLLKSKKSADNEVEKVAEKTTDQGNDSSVNVNNTSTFIKQFGEVTELCKSLSEKLTNEIEQSAQYRSELSRYKAQCEYMDSLCERNRKRMDELFEERDQLFKQVNDLRKAEDSKESELSSYKEKLLNKESEITDVKRENEYLKDNITNLNNCISELKTDLELSIKQRNQDNSLQRDIISQLQGELEGKYVEINSMRKSQDLILQREFDESQRLRQQLKGEHNKYNDLEIRYRELELEKDNLIKKNSELENKLNDGTYIFSKIENLKVSSSLGNSTDEDIKRNRATEESNEIEENINDIKSSLEESKKLQNYWKDLVHSAEKQLESKINELNELKNREDVLKTELEKKNEFINTMEEENRKKQEMLNENIKEMAIRISSMDEEISKKESDHRENLSKLSEENSILRKEIEESRQVEQDLRSQYQNIVRMHSVDIERLQNSNKQCLELKEEIQRITSNSKKTESENTNLILEMQSDISQLRRQLELSSKKYESAKTDNENYRELLMKLRNDQKLPQDYESLIESELSEKRNSIQSPNIGTNSSNSASLLLIRKVQTLTSNLEEMDSKLNECNIEIQRLSFEKKSLRDENELLQKRLSEELEKVTEFATKAENNENTLIRLGELVTLRETNDRLRKELINATERYNNAEKKFESETRLIDPLKCEVSKLNAEIDNLKLQCEEKSVLSKTWEEQYNRILTSYDNINPDEIHKMKDEIIHLKSLNDKLKSALNVKEKEYEKLQTERQSEHISTEELQLTKQQMEQLRKVYMSTNQKLKEERNKNTKLENEIKKLNVPVDVASNPNSNKLSKSEIKNVTQATSNLVNLVLKLTKFSLLRLELEDNKSVSTQECVEDNNEEIIPLKKRPISLNIDKQHTSNTTPVNNLGNL